MNVFLKNLKQEIIDGVNPNWNLNQRMRYVYMMAGKKLTKNVNFFYGLDKKLGNKSLSYDEIKKIYLDNKIDYNEIICKSVSLFLKDIYEEIGVATKLMKSMAFQRIYDENHQEYFDVYHYFLCCTGEDNKKYFLSLSSDLMNIQNNWQTKHFATTINYFQREIKGQKTVAYHGDMIDESVMSLDELIELDNSIGLGVNKESLALNNLVCYENGLPLNSVTYKNSPFIYQHIKGELVNRYTNYLSQNTDFYHNAFIFPNTDGKIISLNDIKLSDLTEEDLDAWYKYMLEKNSLTNVKDKIEVNNKIKAMYEKLKKMRLLIISLNAVEDEEQKKEIVNQIKVIRNSCYSLLDFISYFFVNKNIKGNKLGSVKSTAYLKYRFENLFAYFMVLNQSEPSMLSRSNGLAEKLELIDEVMIDLFGGKIYSKIRDDANITKSVALDCSTNRFHLFFQINGEIYYHLDLDNGTLEIIPDVVEYITKHQLIFVSDAFHNNIIDIEQSMAKK